MPVFTSSADFRAVLTDLPPYAAAQITLEASRRGGQVSVCSERDGVVVEEGPPSQVIDNPREEATRSFLGRIIGHTASEEGTRNGFST